MYVTMCGQCFKLTATKYHNSVWPYCAECRRDPSGEKIYTCGSCGKEEPAYRMETEVMCTECWHALTEDRWCA
jgi:hypothetical protein